MHLFPTKINSLAASKPTTTLTSGRHVEIPWERRRGCDIARAKRDFILLNSALVSQPLGLPLCHFCLVVGLNFVMEICLQFIVLVLAEKCSHAYFCLFLDFDNDMRLFTFLCWMSEVKTGYTKRSVLLQLTKLQNYKETLLIVNIHKTRLFIIQINCTDGKDKGKKTLPCTGTRWQHCR